MLEFIQAQEKINRLAKKSRRKRPPNYRKRVKASRRWKKANKAVSKIQAKVARQRQDWQHQVATQIVNTFNDSKISFLIFCLRISS